MRWFLALVALAAGAWYLRNRQNRERLRNAWQEQAPSGVKTQVEEAAAAARAKAEETAAAARARAEQVKDSAAGIASTAQETVRQAAASATETLQKRAGDAVKSAGDTAANVQQAAGDAVNRAQKAAGDTAERAQQAAGDTAESAKKAASEGGDAAAPVRDTVQTELAEVKETVENVRAQAQAPAEPAEKSAGAAFGAGTTSDTEMKTAHTPGATGQTAPAAPDEEKGKGIAPEGQRPRPVAGEMTTTATGGAVDALSPVSDGKTSTGKAEPLPERLTPSEPGTGGPAGSAQAPSTPDSTETPMTGMERPPEIDRANEVLERTSGNFIGNKKTRVFHAANSGNLPSEENRVYFESENEAVSAGFRPSEREGLESAGS